MLVWEVQSGVRLDFHSQESFWEGKRNTDTDSASSRVEYTCHGQSPARPREGKEDFPEEDPSGELEV